MIGFWTFLTVQTGDYGDRDVGKDQTWMKEARNQGCTKTEQRTKLLFTEKQDSGGSGCGGDRESGLLQYILRTENDFCSSAKGWASKAMGLARSSRA